MRQQLLVPAGVRVLLFNRLGAPRHCRPLRGSLSEGQPTPFSYLRVSDALMITVQPALSAIVYLYGNDRGAVLNVAMGALLWSPQIDGFTEKGQKAPDLPSGDAWPSRLANTARLCEVATKWVDPEASRW